MPPTALLDRLPTTGRVALIAANPIAGARAGHSVVERLCAELERVSLEPQRVENLDQLSSDAENLLAKGELRTVIAAGGDGTIAGVVNCTPPGTPVAILPLGTENLLAKYLKITADPAAIAQMVADGWTTWIDAGRANGRLFLLMASVGFDAEVVRRLHAARDGNIRHTTYIKPIVQTIRNYSYPELRVCCAPVASGNETVIRCRWAFVFNVPRYGFGLRFAPQGESADGKLDLCAFERGGFWNGLRYLTAVMTGRHQRLPEFTTVRDVRFRIESEVEVPYEIDGDPGGVLPLEIEVVPRRVRLLVPKAWSPAAT
jgi:diacylglycerol kinase (ATP)